MSILLLSIESIIIKVRSLNRKVRGNSMDSIGKRIRLLRESKDISMDSLGEAIGTNSGTVSSWENDKKIPGSKYVIALSDYFGVSTDWILKGEGSIGSETDPDFANRVKHAYPYYEYTRDASDNIDNIMEEALNGVIPDTKKTLLLAKALGVSAEWLVLGEGKGPEIDLINTSCSFLHFYLPVRLVRCISGENGRR